MDISLIAAVLAWGIGVGIVFSAIGAAGGILTSFGLITLFAIADPNSVKPMTQIVVLVTALVFVPGYLKRSALVLPLGLLLGAGGLIGAYVGSTISSRYLSDMETFRPLFGVLTLAIAGQIIWQLYSQRHSNNAVGLTEPSTGSAPGPARVSNMKLSLRDLTFSYDARDYYVPLWSPLIAGLLIAMTASIFGVGGGFLLVPYMASLLAMPMHIIPATAAIAIFMSLTVSISNFLYLGAALDWGILAPLLIGAVIGAIAGPTINKAMKNHWLQASLAVIVTGIGLKYTVF